jgi:hypothetical protein
MLVTQDPERTFDRLDNRKSVYAPVEHPRTWSDAPTGIHCNDWLAPQLAGENAGEPCERVRLN